MSAQTIEIRVYSWRLRLPAGWSDTEGHLHTKASGFKDRHSRKAIPLSSRLSASITSCTFTKFHSHHGAPSCLYCRRSKNPAGLIPGVSCLARSATHPYSPDAVPSPARPPLILVHMLSKVTSIRPIDSYLANNSNSCP